jgi:two-component system, chemotaxis family, CheB/CheR fusion protein
MPEMDGFEFLHEYSQREGHDRTPVVAMTGFVTQADRDRTHAVGFAGHLKKPFADVGLVSVVDAALQSRGAGSVELAKRAAGKASGT